MSRPAPRPSSFGAQQTMEANRRADTTPERRLRSELHARGGIIAFMRAISGVETLYTVPANGGPAHALGPGESPDFSPHGDALAFERDGRIWVAHPDGTHRRELAAGYPIGSIPRFSPDGRQIAFISDNNVYVMDRDGHHKHKIADY